MITSRDRILTTHVGSLPRNEKLSDLLIKREASEPYDKKEFDTEMDKAVRVVVDRQKKAGIDISPVAGEKVQKIVADFINTPTAVIAKAKAAMQPRDVTERKKR